MIVQLFLSMAAQLTILIMPLLISNIGEDLITNLLAPFEFFVQFIEQGRNCLHLIFGDGMYIILPIAITLLVLRYTLVPIIIIVRSKFINSNP